MSVPKTLGGKVKKKVIIVSLLLLMFLLGAKSAVATPILDTPRQGESLNNGYPLFQWHDPQGNSTWNVYFFELASSPTVHPSSGQYVDLIDYHGPYYNLYHNWKTAHYLPLPAGTYYWHVSTYYSSYAMGKTFSPWVQGSFTISSPPAPPSNPTLSVSPVSMYFASTQGSNPPSDELKISNFGTGLAYFEVKSSTNRIIFTDHGIVNNTWYLGVDIDATGVSPGAYRGYIYAYGYKDSNYTIPMANSPITIPVDIDIKSATNPTSFPTPPKPKNTKLTASLKPTIIRRGRSSVISGLLRDNTGKVIRSARIYVKRRELNSRRQWVWRTIKTLITNTYGKASYRVSPRKTTYYKLAFTGSSRYNASNSYAVRLTVRR